MWLGRERPRLTSRPTSDDRSSGTPVREPGAPRVCGTRLFRRKSGLLSLLRRIFDSVEGVEDDTGSQDFGQNLWRVAGRSRIEDVGGNSAAAEGGEGLGDSLVVAGPIGANQGDAAVAEALLHIFAIEDDAFVDLAAQAPAGGEIDQDWLALGAI